MNVAAVTENQKNSDLKKLAEKFLLAALSCQEFTLFLSLFRTPFLQAGLRGCLTTGPPFGAVQIGGHNHTSVASLLY